MIKPGVLLICSLQLCLVACRAQVPGCTDPLANNYDPSATVNNGSCTYYPISVSPSKTMVLSETVSETSGLILWDGNLWTHNDDGDLNIYGLDISDGAIGRTYGLDDVENNQWEEISQDSDYLYLGDFGNNVSGDRADLHILRIKKGSLLSGNPQIDTIWFSYSDQLNLDPVGPNETDFDCEAFIVSEDNIYLFTKQWTSMQTSVYTLPKLPGEYTAEKIHSYDINGLITGASYHESKQMIVLCGYNSLVHPFLVLLYDYHNNDFFSGNKRRITVSLPFHQVEGIASSDGLKYYVTNESLVIPLLANNPQKLHVFDLNDLLEDYLNRTGPGDTFQSVREDLLIFPNPAASKIYIKAGNNQVDQDYEVIDQLGKVLLSGNLNGGVNEIDISSLAVGIYVFKTGKLLEQIFRVVKL